MDDARAGAGSSGISPWKDVGETVFADSQSLFSTAGGHAAMMRWYEHALEHAQIAYESIVVPTRFGESHLIAAGPKDAPPLVLLHGMEGNAASWRHQLVGLEGHFRLYALDIIGSAGKSVPTRLSHDNDDHAKWLGDVLTALNIEQANLAGISNGSWLVLKFAAYAPQRVARAALMSASGIVPVRFPYNLARVIDGPVMSAMKDVLAGALLTRDMVRRAVSGTYVANAEADPQEIEWFYLLAKYYRFRFPPGPVTDAELASLTAPTLLMMGEDERFFPVHAVIERAHRFMPQVVTEIVQGVGHNMCTDNPTLINARLRDFFTEPAHVASA
ncbi:MAG TPA: alpha/beta hydrolase [Ktedonobacterales bacterium]